MKALLLITCIFLAGCAKDKQPDFVPPSVSGARSSTDKAKTAVDRAKLSNDETGGAIDRSITITDTLLLKLEELKGL